MPTQKEKKHNLEKLLEREGITEKELKTILKSSHGVEPKRKKTRLYLPGKHVKYGYFSDAHIGHETFQEDLFEKMAKMMKREGVDFIIDCGDHLEGMSNRPGHIYELKKIGFSEQIKYAAELYNELPAKTFGIDGNHDQWYFKPQNMGIVVGDELEKRVKKYRNLGQDEADLEIAPGITLKLFHANDGSAYATSYKLQKLIESFTGGEKPNIVHSGHYHKALYMFLRNVHGFESGTLADQSSYMRGKKLQAHMGFGIVDAYYHKNGIDRIKHEFVPHYSKNSNKNKGYKK